MDNKYVDVVLVNTAMNGRKVRIAPAFSHLEVGDRVKIQVDYNPFEIEGTVSDVATFGIDSEEFQLLRSFAGMKDIRFEADMRVTKRVTFKELWPEEELEGEDEEGGNANG